MEKEKFVYLEAVKDEQNCVNALKCPRKHIPFSCETQGSCCGDFFGERVIDDTLYVACRR